MEVQKVIIENYSKLDDDNIVNIIEVLSKMDSVEEFRVDSEMKFVEVVHRSNIITKDTILKKLESSINIKK